MTAQPDGPGPAPEAPPAGSGFGWSLARTLGFAGLYVVATYVGRLTIMDSTNLSMVWPAAGIGAVWFVAQRSSRWRVLDVAALAVITMVVNTATGATPVLAGFFVVANVVQAALFAYLFGRWLPELWGGGGDATMSRAGHLWRLIAIAGLTTAGGALIGPTGVWLVSGEYSIPATAVWLTRNTASILLIGTAGLRVGYLLHHRLNGDVETRCSTLRSRWAATTVARRVEYLSVVALSAATYGAIFGLPHRLPLAFVPIVMTVWAGSRLNTTFVIAHDLTFGCVAVLLTLNGTGPFGHIESHPARALVAQLFIGIVAAVGLALALGRDERDALLDDLRTAEDSAARQAMLVTSIVDAMAEGLAVIDQDGRMLLRNPAAVTLLGGVTTSTGRMAGNDYYGLFHSDGTPVPAGELPHHRALATGEPHGMDIVVRNPGLPQGRTLAVRATPLPGEVAGIRYAVSVFSDVTADRRHRDELVAFAGVVAHDLLNPLATVDGWSAELLEDPADAGSTRDGLIRIQRAAVRMRALIEDLLAHATARDSPIAPTRMELAEVVTDIVVARVDQAMSIGRPVPQLVIGELPAVHADPALLRQLLDNLIGNAIKYTSPETVPRIEVTTSVVGDNIRVDVTDNGIGIPAGQHEAVFDNFHRAHRSAGFTGTGLGLAICKRIVERHGGTIAAYDNPGGGTRISFTLAAVDLPAPDRPRTPTPA